MTSPPRPGYVPAEWGPDTCTRPAPTPEDPGRLCGGALPPGLIALGRTQHVDCDEARAAWRNLAADGKQPRVLPPRPKPRTP